MAPFFIFPLMLLKLYKSKNLIFVLFILLLFILFVIFCHYFYYFFIYFFLINLFKIIFKIFLKIDKFGTVFAYSQKITSEVINIKT